MIKCKKKLLALVVMILLFILLLAGNVTIIYIFYLGKIGFIAFTVMFSILSSFLFVLFKNSTDFYAADEIQIYIHKFFSGYTSTYSFTSLKEIRSLVSLSDIKIGDSHYSKSEETGGYKLIFENKTFIINNKDYIGHKEFIEYINSKILIDNKGRFM
jgi:energy-coupling factor transporter transmembrane protein EcfT